MLQDLSTMVGKRLLVGITYVTPKGDVAHRVEFAGDVLSAAPVVAVARPGHDHPFTLPPHPEAFAPAAPGEYRLDSTGEVVVDPDFITKWTVSAPVKD